MTHYMINNSKNQTDKSLNESSLLQYDLCDLGMVLLRP